MAEEWPAFRKTAFSASMRRTISGRWARPVRAGRARRFTTIWVPKPPNRGARHEQFPLDGGGRFVEIWNLVFMQYDRDAGGKLTPLPRPSIDTGMGLERVAAVLQGKLSNYDTDLICPIIERAGGAVQRRRTGADARVDTALRIAADHARATAFLIHDGVLPANEGRGYVLRKIMRRAMRNARLVGVEDPFLYKLTGFVAELMRAGLSGTDGKRAARGARGERRRASLRHHVPGSREGVSATKSRSSAGMRFPARSRSSCTTPTGWRSMSRKRWLASTGSHRSRRLRCARWSSSASAPAPVGRAREKGAVAPAYQELLEQGRTKFLGYADSEADSRVIGLLVDSNWWTQFRPVRKPNWCSTRRRSMPRPAARWATAARLYCAIGREGGRSGDAYSRRARADRASHRSRTLPFTSGDVLRAEVAGAAARLHAAQPHGHASAARRAAAGAGHAREAGGQRGGTSAPALRLHALCRHGSRRTGRSRAADERADPAETRRSRPT